MTTLTTDISCQVIECGELEESRGFCSLHLRRFVGGNVRDVNGEWVDFCAKNHPMTGDNVRWESSGKRGKKRRRCRACLREKAQRQSKDKITEVEVPKPYRPNDLTLTHAISNFEEALNHVTAKCKSNPGPYMDWDDEHPPTADEAAAMCAGCPLIKPCGNFAIAAQITDGVWGGRVISKGVWLS